MSSTGSRDKVDEIKDVLDIVDVIGRDISLKHNGGGKYTGATSATSKSGSSLKVDQQLRAFKNFASGEGGDVLDWIGYINKLDTRGSDFPEVLKIAAALAGVELEDATEEELNAAKEKADIHNLFTEAAEIYHKNLNPEHYNFIMEKWGITKETVEKLKIGYATTGRDLKELDKTILKKSGLAYVNGGMLGGEVFKGRIIFPYWKNGKVVYLIGRQTDETPLSKEGNEPPKYQKLIVHKEDRGYVSPVVQNSYFYGEDSLRGSDYCIITEGVADCIAMLQAGFPCISPVTTTFRENDHPKLISLTKKLNRVYICNDNEANEAGLKGALSTAEALEKEGIEARLIILPKPEDIDKIDIADYMKDHSQEDFTGLIESSVRLWDFKLNQLSIPTSSTSLERFRAFKIFISNDLAGMSSEEWQVFVNNDVSKKFRFSKKDIERIVDITLSERSHRRNAAQSHTEEDKAVKTETEKSNEYLTETYSPEILERANEILNTADAFVFALKTWGKLHAGDENIGENLLCSVVCTQIDNAKLGLHQKPSGEFGSGKSDAMRNVVRLLPAHKCIEGSISSKTLFYDEWLKTGTIVFIDDVSLKSDDIISTLNAITSDFQEPATHRTLTRTKEGKLVAATMMIPPRITLWMTSVASIQDQQLESRFCFGDTDESPEQDDRANKRQKERLTSTYSFKDDPDVLTCQCIFDIIFQNTYKVYAPLIDPLEWNNKERRRNMEKFMDLLQAVAVFNFRQRKTAHGGIVATYEDYKRALKIYMGTAAKNATNLNGRELQVIQEIQQSPKQTINFNELLKKTGIKLTTLRYLINGRDGREGLLGKVSGLYELDNCETVGSDNCKTSTRTKVYRYEGNLFDVTSKIYQLVAKIDEAVAVKITEDFVASDTGNLPNYHNYHTTITNNVIVKNNSSIDNNIINNNIITEKEEEYRGNCNTISQQSKSIVEKNLGILSSCDSCDNVIVEQKTECGGNNATITPLSQTTQLSQTPDSTITNADTKDLNGLRKDLKTFYGTYLEDHGGIEGIEVFVGAFLWEMHGYEKIFSRNAIIYEAEKVCKAVPQNKGV